MRERTFGIVAEASDFNEKEFNLEHKDEIDQYNQSLELPIEDFKRHADNARVDDETVEKMFWDIYKQGNADKIKQALDILEKNPSRKKLLLEVAEAIANDKKS